MIYSLWIEAKEEEINNFLEKNKFKKNNFYWVYDNVLILNDSTALDKLTGKVTLRLETPTTPKYNLEME